MLLRCVLSSLFPAPPFFFALVNPFKRSFLFSFFSPFQFFFIWFLFFFTYEDWYSFVCSDHALDLFYFFILFPLHRECPLSWVDRFQTTASATPTGSLFSFCFHFFFLGKAREKYLTYPAKLFASQSIYGTDLTDTASLWAILLASIYNVPIY